jgi:hypothetical protein
MILVRGSDCALAHLWIQGEIAGFFCTGLTGLFVCLAGVFACSF